MTVIEATAQDPDKAVGLPSTHANDQEAFRYDGRRPA